MNRMRFMLSRVFHVGELERLYKILHEATEVLEAIYEDGRTEAEAKPGTEWQKGWDDACAHHMELVRKLVEK